MALECSDGFLFVFAQVKAIASVANRADDCLKVAEFGSKSSNVNVNGARATEIVVAPNFA